MQILAASLLCGLIADGVAVEVLGAPIGVDGYTATAAVVVSVAYFLMVAVVAIFFVSRHDPPRADRLAAESLLSLALCVTAFALAYRHLGISLGETCAAPTMVRDYVYFSAVTFTTLGYGDFRPCEGARLLAAFEALLGNLHLGLVVGAAILFAQGVGGSEARRDRRDEADREKAAADDQNGRRDGHEAVEGPLGHGASPASGRLPLEYEGAAPPLQGETRP